VTAAEAALRGPAPLVGASVWLVALEAANDRCQCVGSCGSEHRKGNGRCHITHTPAHRLQVAPAEVLTPLPVAVTLRPSKLRAWCPTCLAGTARAARGAVVERLKQLGDTAASQLDLFATEHGADAHVIGGGR